MSKIKIGQLLKVIGQSLCKGLQFKQLQSKNLLSELNPRESSNKTVTFQKTLSKLLRHRDQSLPKSQLLVRIVRKLQALRWQLQNLPLRNHLLRKLRLRLKKSLQRKTMIKCNLRVKIIMMMMNKNRTKMRSQRDSLDHQLKKVSRRCRLNNCCKNRKMNKNNCTKSKSHRRRSRSKGIYRTSSSALITIRRSFS